MRLKFLTGIFVITGLVISNAQPVRILPSADELFKKACLQATNENKNVFVIFHASWCGWCHKMDTSMNDKACKKFFDKNYVILHFTVDESKGKENLETPGAKDFRKKYNGEGQGIPFWLVFDKSGNLLADSKIRQEGEGPEAGQNMGCPASKEEVAYFIKVLKKTSSLLADKLPAIEKRFRMNE